MKSIIPYTRSISFGSKIAEITSMSLEHELTVKPEEIGGNFIISGDYRTHEVSVNREPFLYKLPFTIELTEGIDLDSLEFEIVDFSYDILNDDTIEVSISFRLEAEELETLEEVVVSDDENETERSVFEPVQDEVEDVSLLVDQQVKEEIDEKNAEIQIEDFIKESEPMNELEGGEDKREETMIEEQKKVEVVDQNIISKNEMKEDMKESEEVVIQNVNPMDDSFATYHIHIVKNGESVETICTMYQSNMNLLHEYNDFSEIQVGDKLIIPKEDE